VSLGERIGSIISLDWLPTSFLYCMIIASVYVCVSINILISSVVLYINQFSMEAFHSTAATTLFLPFHLHLTKLPTQP
jgi:NADPH-dependent 7-cyano-7-deazaguanine reductase QueF-like protein